MNQHYFDVPFAFSGDKTAIPDPLQTGGTVSFTEGWNYNYQRNLATDPAALPIDRSTMNWLLNQVTTALQALQQNAIPEFITSAQNGGVAFSYGPQARVMWSSSGSAPFAAYVNITGATNTNTPSASDPTGATTGWQVVCDPIATSAQASAGTNNASIMTPLLVAQQVALRALLAGNSSQVFNVGPATSTTHALEAGQIGAIGSGGTLPINTSAKINGVNNPNLMFNGSGEFGAAGWTLASFVPVTDLGTGLGNFFTNTGALTSFTGTQSGAQIPIGASQQLTISIDLTNSATSGTVTVALPAFNAAGTFLSYVVASVVANGTGQTRYSFTGSTPANTAFVLPQLTLTSVSAGAYGIEFRRMKVELGNTPSLYSAEANQAATFANGIVGEMCGAHAKLTANAKTFTFTADNVIVGSALNGAYYRASNVNLTINTATIGAGGMNTGTPTASGFVAVYLLYSPSNGAMALLAVNEAAAVMPNICNAPNIPSGYTASALIGVYGTDSSGNFVAFHQQNRKIAPVGVAASLTNAGPITLSGMQWVGVPATALAVIAVVVDTNGNAAADSLSIFMWPTGGPEVASFNRNLNNGGISWTSPEMMIDRETTPRTSYITITSSGGGAQYTIIASSYTF